jgi:hypothetical protein
VREVVGMGMMVMMMMMGWGIGREIDRMTDWKACKAGYAMSSEMGDYGRAMERCMEMLTEKNP